MSERRECCVVRPKCGKKAIWFFSNNEDDYSFNVEYCEDCYNLLKDIFPLEGWTKAV